MSPAEVVAIRLSPASPTRRNASRSACAYVVEATHMPFASPRRRFSHAAAASCPAPGRVGVPAPASGPVLTTYPPVIALTVTNRSGSTARQVAARTRPS
nr:hypothetical protein CPGR_02168 [Mycolicibacterium komanii]